MITGTRVLLDPYLTQVQNTHSTALSQIKILTCEKTKQLILEKSLVKLQKEGKKIIHSSDGTLNKIARLQALHLKVREHSDVSNKRGMDLKNRCAHIPSQSPLHQLTLKASHIANESSNYLTYLEMRYQQEAFRYVETEGGSIEEIANAFTDLSPEERTKHTEKLKMWIENLRTLAKEYGI